MSAKLRLTAWFTLMMLLLSAMVLVFILVINGSAITDDPEGRLIKVVDKNVHNVEFERGVMEWDSLSAYDHGVYCSYYDASGAFLYGAAPAESFPTLPLTTGPVRQESLGEQPYYVYDCYMDMAVGGLWVRGCISQADSSGVMNTILTLTAILLPSLLLLTVAGGWLIARGAFRPMEKIMAAAEAISDGSDLSGRVALRRGPSEMKALSRTFDSMFSRLEKSFNAEKQFASDASHELRTPITVILSQCDRARRKDKTPEDFLQSIQVIQEQGNRMSALVDQLLNLTRLQQGTDRYPLRELDLSALTEACAAEFLPADDRGITFSTDIEQGVTADCNPTLYSRVVFNLLQNAYKYGREGGSVKLSLKTQGWRAQLSVTDDGIGIAQEELPKIWQRFYQVDASRGEDGGSGLGLAMVKEIAEYHGGAVGAESHPGAGSTFTVTFPKKIAKN
jgi:signal transduction histidine kinase